MENENTTHIQYYFPKAIPLLAYFGILFVSGLCGNLLVIYVYGTKYKESATRVLILALAGFDILSSLAIPFRMVDQTEVFTLGHVSSVVVCKIAGVLPACQSFGSGIVLVVVAVDRYRKICTPHKRVLSSRNAKIIIVMACIVAAVLSFPDAVMTGRRTVEVDSLRANITYCLWSDEFEDSSVLFIYTIMQMCFFVIIFTLYIIFYFLIWKQVISMTGKVNISNPVNSNAQALEMTTSSGDESTETDNLDPSGQDIQTLSTPQTSRKGILPLSKETKKTSPDSRPNCIQMSTKPMTTPGESPRIKKAVRKTTLMLFVLTCVTGIAYIPYFITTKARDKHVENIVNMNGIVFALYSISSKSYYINSACNPIIYSVCNPVFRQKCRKVFRISSRT